jgi:NAD(P)-dependent dehydrogenase (short-subunit alcohol dehydrogenase family)
MIDLKGHAALVTGSSKGVGRSIAEAFARAGADVLIHGRAIGPDAQEVIGNCRAAGVRAEFVGGDLSGSVEEEVPKLADAAFALMPRLSILVNNAGQFFDLPFEQNTVERFEKTLRLNVTSQYFLTQAFARRWIAGGVRGRVLFIGSINGRLAEEGSTGYDTSKGAVEMMVRTLCVALAPKGIRVNGLAPGLVRTPQTAWIDRKPTTAAWIAHHTPNHQIPHSDVCGPGAVYLCSDDAEHVHGQMLLVDGGMSAWQQPGPMSE